MIYIVYWIVLKMTPTPCPNFGDGRTACLVAHYKYEETKDSIIFNNRDSAFTFYNNRIRASKAVMTWEMIGIDSLTLLSINH